MYVVCLVWEEYTIGKSKGKKKSVREKYKKNCMVGITLVPINNLFRWGIFYGQLTKPPPPLKRKKFTTTTTTITTQ